MTAARPAAATTPYWKDANLCLARPDSSAESHPHDGRVERIGSDERSFRHSKKPGGASETASVTWVAIPITPILRKEVTSMNDS